MKDLSDYTEQNRKAWDEIAEVRHRSGYPPAEFFARGGLTLDAQVLEAAGDVRGRSVLHLQCATGSDTLSWSVRGAQATGIDISGRQIEIARRTAQQAGLDTRFIAADIYHLPDELTRGIFDLVFTGGGAIAWLPDLEHWAQVVSAALKTGGRLILQEIHPLAGCLAVEDGRLQIVDDYFGRSRPQPNTGWAHFKGAEQAAETKYEFSWSLGDILTALAQAGLCLERLEEYPSEAEWRFGDQLDQVGQLPGEFLLTARKT